MDEVDFYKQLGFRSNPFQYTNADEEDNLKDYFIPPPYFQSVWGDPQKASSCVVFAPRGGGKSAQRKMIEIRSQGSTVLALQYTRFEFDKGRTLKNIDLEYHLKNINRICLVALLMLIYQMEVPCLAFNATDRAHIRALCNFYLYDLSSDEIINAVNSIIPLYEKAKDFFKRNLWAINSIIDAIFNRIGLAPIKSSPSLELGITSASKNHLELIISLIKSFGIESVYMLIDKVDETQLTGNDSKVSFDLIEPIIRDLDLLQLKDIGFKFFLWNELSPFYKKYARPDRVQQFSLNWKDAELKGMMQLRLQAYSSEGNIVKFPDLLDPSIEEDLRKYIEDWVIVFSHGSPRDMIRICSQMVTEQLRVDSNARRITIPAVTVGFNIFCKQRAEEVVSDQILNDLQKNHRLDFTVNYIANDIFKISIRSAMAKIRTWLNTGVVKYIEDTPINGSKKPVHRYAVMDSRVAKTIFTELRFSDFLKNKVRFCSKCGTVMFRDWDISPSHICHNCKARYDAA